MNQNRFPSNAILNIKRDVSNNVIKYDVIHLYSEENSSL